MVSSGTLESVEFLEVVGGDLEVPPDEYFGLEKKSSKTDFDTKKVPKNAMV